MTRAKKQSKREGVGGKWKPINSADLIVALVSGKLRLEGLPQLTIDDLAQETVAQAARIRELEGELNKLKGGAK